MKIKVAEQAETKDVLVAAEKDALVAISNQEAKDVLEAISDLAEEEVTEELLLIVLDQDVQEEKALVLTDVTDVLVLA